MRYHSDKPTLYFVHYGRTYYCNHPVYDKCTLFKVDNKGLAVIQQRCKNKHTYWTDIDPWLNDTLYLNEGFNKYFNRYAAEAHHGLYPTVTIRQIMWALKLKPIKREPWETVFDKCPIYDSQKQHTV